MTEPPFALATNYLLQVARRVAMPYVAWPITRAAMVMGSAAEGESDYYSDLDIAIYYDMLPSDEELAAAREANQGMLEWRMGERNDGTLAEGYLVDGIECQFAHATIDAWERDIDRVLVELDVTSPLQKALDGTLHGIPLFGEQVIDGWKQRATRYPDALAEAMVKHYLSFFPLWYLQERFSTRDAVLWHYQAMVESAQHLLGVLSGLNRLYYATFQFKRMRRSVGQMTIAPPRIAERLEGLFNEDRRAGVEEMERLVADVVSLVAQQMPQIDTANVRKYLGQRQEPWTPRTAE